MMVFKQKTAYNENIGNKVWWFYKLMSIDFHLYEDILHVI